MKFYTIALFLGVISAEEYEEELANALKISLSKEGERKIEKEAKDVGRTWKAIEDSKPVRNLESSLKRFCHSKEMMNIKKLDKKFMASKEGKRLIAEWKDVGKVLKKNLKKTKAGYLHFPNSKIDDLSDELDDVADQYEQLGKGKGGWNKKYEAAWKAALANKSFGSLKRRGKAFKHSKEGKALKKEICELKMAIKKNLKITDLPKKALECDSDDSDDEALESLLKISVSKEGEKAIEKEARDIKETWKKIENSAAVRNVENSFKRWAHTKQVAAIKALDKKFLASKQGKRLMAEWKDFGEALKKAIVKTKDGIHIKNSEIDHISDELDDVADQYEQIGKGPWGKAYDKVWKAALSTKQAKSLHRRLKAFKKSKEGQALKKEIVDLKMALKKHLKITDLPKKKLLDSDSDSDDDKKDDDEVLEEIEQLIKISISKSGRKEIEKEWNDVEHVWKKIKNSRVVRNVESSLKRLEESKEMKQLEQLDKKFMKTKLGKRTAQEIDDVFDVLHKSLKVDHKKHELHIDNKKLQDLDDEIHDVEVVAKQFKKSPWDAKYKAAFKKVFDSKSAHSVYRRLHSFKKSAEGKALKKEMHDLKMALKKNVKITDLPKKTLSEEETNEFLF